MTVTKHEDPPEIFHPAHRGHILKLVPNAAGATATTTFVCDGCKEPGHGARYTCGSCEVPSFDLHPPCALAEEDATLEHPLFRGSKFVLLPEPPAPVDGTVCDACGEPARGLVYHCFEDDLDLHPCCACLPERILHDGRVFDLRGGRKQQAAAACGLCGGRHGGHRRKFWAYRSYFDGEAVDLHVACMKDVARLSWEASYRSHGGGGGGGGGEMVLASLTNIERTLQSLPANKRRKRGFDRFVEIVGTVASIIIAVIFGNPVAMMAAIAGPGGLLRG